MKKILYIFDARDWDSRMAIAYGAQKKGMDVVIGLVDGQQQHIEKASGFKIVLLSSSRMIRDVNALIKEENPGIIHAVTLKYGFLTGLAAFSSKNVRKIYTLAGLGYLFRSHTVRSWILCAVLRPFLTFVFRQKNTMLIFQNPDDLDLMVEQKYVSRKHAVLIKGSGVYLDRFIPHSSEHHDGIPIVLMPTRLVHEKGVSVFIEAARILKKRGIEAHFQIAGGETKHNPHAISREGILEMTKDSAVQWLGRVDDMPACLSQASLIVYPSYYGEGIPRVLLEACAAGRAIITTDHPGCREAVENGVNGLLVPVKNALSTADATQTLLHDSDQRTRMEKQSRKRAEKEFDIHLITQKTLNLYENKDFDSHI